MSHLLNLNSGSLTDSLLGRGNYHVNLFLGRGVNPLNYEDTFVNFSTISQGFGGSWLQLTIALVGVVTVSSDS